MVLQNILYTSEGFFFQNTFYDAHGELFRTCVAARQNNDFAGEARKETMPAVLWQSCEKSWLSVSERVASGWGGYGTSESEEVSVRQRNNKLEELIIKSKGQIRKIILTVTIYGGCFIFAGREGGVKTQRFN